MAVLMRRAMALWAFRNRFHGAVMKTFAKTFLATGLLAGILAGSFASAQAADLRMPVKAVMSPVPATEWVNIFAGLTVAPHAVYGEAGAVFAFNRDINADGWLFRLKGGAGHYSYLRTPLLLRQGADFQTGDIMVGYQKFLSATTRATLYLGANIENHDNSDLLAQVRGTEAGVKVIGEIYSQFNPGVYGLATGSYASTFDTYYAMGKLGFQVTPTISIGPEVAALGNDRFDALRGGAFIAFNFARSAQFIVSGGYNADNGRAGSFGNSNGGYVTLHLRGNL
jgi:hypothetical protein